MINCVAFTFNDPKFTVLNMYIIITTALFKMEVVLSLSIHV